MKKGKIAGKKSAPSSKPEWLTVCPNCGYPPKGMQGSKKPAPQRLQKAPDLRMRCPICFYHGPAIEVRAEDYRDIRFAHQKIADKDEGKLIWPEIVLMLIVSAVVVLILWKLARSTI